MPGQVLAYVRVSSADQNPDRQTAAILDALTSEPDRWFTDHASGASTNRPALEAMLAHTRDEDTLVVASMDRLARSVIDLDQLVTQLTGDGVTVRFLKEALTFQPAVRADPLAGDPHRFGDRLWLSGGCGTGGGQHGACSSMQVSCKSGRCVIRDG